MNSNQKGPLTPSELFNRLMGGDYREVECIDEGEKLRQQKEVLVQLIIEYEHKIEEINAANIMEEEQLQQTKERLIGILEALRSDRCQIENKISGSIQTLRATSVEPQEQGSFFLEINDIRIKNSKLKNRINDMMVYVRKLELQNKNLESKRRSIEESRSSLRLANDNWKGKMDVQYKDCFNYESDIRQKMRIKEEEAHRKMAMQQQEMHERNRARMQSMTSNVTPYTPYSPDLRYRPYIRQI